MCGIVGYVGERRAAEVLLNGLRKLEYRGYDSAGIATIDGDDIHIRRAVGKLENLESVLEATPLGGSTGIGHTRWATHGRPSEQNAHPHRSGDVVVIPAGVPHGFRQIDEAITYLSIRIDPDQVLPAGYVNPVIQ